MKSRLLSVISLLLNLVIVTFVALSIVAFHTSFLGDVKTDMSIYLYFTTLSNIVVGVVSLIEIPFFIYSISSRRNEVPGFLQVMKLVSVTLVTITMVTALTWLANQMGIGLMIEGVNLFLHVLTPSIALLSFLIFEIQNRIKFKHTFWVVIPMALYIAFYFSAVFFIKVGAKDWYMFAYDYTEAGRSENINILKSVLSIVIFLLVPIVVAIVLWFINQFFRKAIFGRVGASKEYYDEVSDGMESNEEVKEEEEKPSMPEYRAKVEVVSDSGDEEKKEKTLRFSLKRPLRRAKPVASSEYGKYEGKTRVYHISQSKNVDGQWQVKLAGGDRAIKIFKTQKEAIDYAKSLIRTQGGSIRIHSMKGKMRKS